MSVYTANSLGQAGGVLDALHCGAVIVGPDGIIVQANARFCDMVRRPPLELMQRPFWTFYAPEDAQRLQEKFRQDTSGEVEEETCVPGADGERIPVIVSSRPLGYTASLAEHRIITVIDISRQKRAETRYQQQYQEVSRLSDAVLEQALDLKHYSKTLEQQIRERTAELRDANMDSILMLAVASEARDTDTGDHVLRIREYARLLAHEVGLSESESEEIGFSAVLHDVGKIHVPDEILKKPGRLTAEERKAMEFHAIAGERILSKRPFFDAARVIARNHHENWDGSGYPDGTAGTDIRLAARIVHLVDVFDALTTPRVYKPAWPLEDAVAEIERSKGTMFDPQLVEVFAALLAAGAFDEIMALRTPPSTSEKT